MTELLELLEPIKPGEYEVKKYLRGRGFKVKDVSDNRYYCARDIDLIATNPITGKSAAIEVKLDARIDDTGNFFIEFENPRSENSKGWFNFCEADFIYYIDESSFLTYIIKFDELRHFIATHKRDLAIKSTFDGSIGYIVPLAAMPVFTTIQL